MAIIVLTAICLLACVFLLFALVQWTRDTKRRTTTRFVTVKEQGEAHQGKRRQAVGSRVTPISRNCFRVRARRLSDIADPSEEYAYGHDERERIAYERIARSFRLHNRS